ncbi:rRNA maturation RNase YbeY [Coxiella-like endosymbiont of Rhipicephalus sanguineus]|uniref:rRNA maturation RNase YbeY n=1 Tax=Coxiella-like endosymbiont of Rhipicephalus sanguineus TaxID=1955402 RepID=UPI002041EF78|nr:rRNA maturation RNase YbeY [Coxiella-like endosymbiont of Rhipicephalus sanguineus]MBT8506332.1 rRNA maturation RNase YbeY [Coxiella-like endosymbiont of Rhipicephalus sanguineus]
MKLHIEVQNATKFSSLPTLSQLQKWVNTAFQFVPVTLDKNLSELTIRFIDREESAALNETYRHKKGPTNILSFSEDPILGLSSDSLGDLAICAPIVAEEAEAQNKSLEAHFAHLVIHGVLHLLGYDHIEIQEAAEMEGLEINILSQLGYLSYKDPYEDG